MIRFIVKRAVPAVALAALVSCNKKSDAPQEILLGEYGSMTGGTATFGISNHRGVEMAVDAANVLYAMHSSAAQDDLLKLDTNGKMLARYKKIVSSVNKKDPAINLKPVVDGVGNIYMISQIGDQIYLFDKNGQFTNRFGEAGKQPGQLDHPGPAVIDGQNRLVIFNSGRIDRFSTSGRYIDGLTIGPVIICSFTFLLLAYAACAWFPHPAALAGILVAGLADPAGAVVGTRFGGGARKSVPGSAAVAGVAMLVIVAVGVPWLTAVLAAAAAAGAERWSGAVDDNLVVAPVTAAVVAVLA